MTLRNVLRRDYSECLVNRLQDEGCRLRLDEIDHDHILFSGIKYKILFNYQENLCDFILFVNPDKNPVRVAIVELKGGFVDAREFDKAFRQLKNGANVAGQILDDVAVDQFGVFLTNGGISSMVTKVLRQDKYKVDFRGQRKPIRIKRCGDSLPNSWLD